MPGEKNVNVMVGDREMMWNFSPKERGGLASLPIFMWSEPMEAQEHLCEYIHCISVCKKSSWSEQDVCKFSSKSMYRDACMWFYEGRCGNADANIKARISADN